MNQETKSRLVAAGKWEQYNDLKYKYINEGLDKKVAEQKALMDVDRPHAKGGDPYKRLVQAVPQGHCSEREAAQFVFEHVSVPAAEIEASAVPSRGAVGLLKWVQSSPANQTAFYATIWMKLMPTKSQLDAEARYSDDGIRSIELLDRLEQMLGDEEEDMQGVREESGPSQVQQEQGRTPDGMQIMSSDAATQEEIRPDPSGVHGDVRTTVRVRPDYTDTT
ncbi:MAG: hypothetical protein Unbinned2706contig1001_27 [Prokaryotic dsDNA virus sp.]|nr:MAG: hypothetical protein Unbinned2706contig1001_27 [Prokaryotic dsDNA virus sp.]